MVGGGEEVVGVVAGIGLVGVLVGGSVGTAGGILFGIVVVGPGDGAPVGQNDGIVVVIGLFHGANVGRGDGDSGGVDCDGITGFIPFGTGAVACRPGDIDGATRGTVVGEGEGIEEGLLVGV